jgi:hypothetical protein
MATQQTFPIDFTPSYGRKNFIEASCNTIALQTIEQWPNWPSYGLVVYGPKGSGKTHLAHIFSQKAGAVFLGREKLRDPKLFVTLPPAANVIVDEVDVQTGHAEDGAGQVRIDRSAHAHDRRRREPRRKHLGDQ